MPSSFSKEHWFLHSGRGFARGCIVGGGVKLCLAAGGKLFSGKVRSLDAFLKIARSDDVLRFALFAGAFNGVFRLTKHALRGARGGKQEPVDAFIAGGVSGLTLLIDSPKDRDIFVLYAFVRACQFLHFRARRKKQIPEIPYGWVLLFQLCCLEIIYAWFFHPRTLPRTYVKWIDYMSQLDPRVLKGLRDYHAGKPVTEWFANLARDNGYDPTAINCNPHEGLLPCCITVHPRSGNDCPRHWFSIFTTSFAKSFAMYLPIHSSSTLVRLLSGRASIPTALRRLLENISRSATFLSAFITIIYVCVCTFRRTLQDDYRIGYFMGAALCGLSLAIEKDFRREEIALYCVPRALHSVLTRLASTKAGKGLSRMQTVWEIALFSASTAVMMGHFDIHADDISRTHLWVMERVFGR